MNKTHTIAAIIAVAAFSISALAADDVAPPATPVKAGSVSKLTPEQLAKVGATGFSRNWTVDELYKEANLALNAGGRSFERGQKVFDTIGCALCHHFGGGTGGIGPDLTGVGGKFGAPEILQSIIEPSAVISDLYSTVTIYTDDGKKYTGRPQGSDGDNTILIGSFGIDPATGTMAWNGPQIKVPNAKITDQEESGISPMPPGLINNYNKDEIFDLLAFLISAGNPADKMFQAARSDFPPPPAK